MSHKTFYISAKWRYKIQDKKLTWHCMRHYLYLIFSYTDLDFSPTTSSCMNVLSFHVTIYFLFCATKATRHIFGYIFWCSIYVINENFTCVWLIHIMRRWLFFFSNLTLDANVNSFRGCKTKDNFRNTVLKHKRKRCH